MTLTASTRGEAMVTAEQVAQAYWNAEKDRNGFDGRTHPDEGVRTAWLIFDHIWFGWTCENPAPKGKGWGIAIPSRMPELFDDAE